MERYVLKEATTRMVLDQCVEVMWEAHHNPNRIMFQSFFPILGPTPEDEQAAIQEAKDRLWKLSQYAHSGHWFYVEDGSTGEIVGTTHWHIHLQSTKPSGPLQLEATWWPEGEGREFASRVIRQTLAPRLQFMNGPYLVAGFMSVPPKHRGKGIGKMLMSWGMRKAEELDYPCWMEATETGRILYEKYGFRVLFRLAFDGHKDHPSARWKEMQETMAPEPFYAMWKPARGQTFEGGTILPWKARPKITLAKENGCMV